MMIYKRLARRLLFNRIIKLAVQIDVAKLKENNPTLSLEIDDLIESDPSGTNKYIIWGVKQLKNGEELSDILSAISFFHNNIQSFKKKDINQYYFLPELQDNIKEVSYKKSKFSIINEKAKSGTVKLFEKTDNKNKPIWRLYRIDNRFAAQIMGKGTRWCITQQENSYYERYASANVLFYYIINYKKEERDPNHKFAAAVKRDMENNIQEIEWFDAVDKRINDSEIIAAINFPNIENIIINDAEKQPKGLLAKIKDNTATEEEIDKAIKIVTELKENINNNPNSTEEEKESAQIYEDSVFDKNNKIVQNKIISLSIEGNKAAISKLNINTPEARKIIIELAKKDNEKAIYRLNYHYPEMIPIIIELAKKGNEVVINNNFTDNMIMIPIIIELAKQGYEFAIDRLSPFNPKMIPVIIELALAKKGNKRMIYKLNPSFPQQKEALIELAENGIKIAQEILERYSGIPFKEKPSQDISTTASIYNKINFYKKSFTS